MSIEQLKLLLTAIGTILVPATIAWTGNEYSQAAKERESQDRYVELAVNILSQDPKPDTTALRQWALDIIETNSPVPLPTGARSELDQSNLLKQIQEDLQRSNAEYLRQEKLLEQQHESTMKSIEGIR